MNDLLIKEYTKRSGISPLEKSWYIPYVLYLTALENLREDL